ncbi:branched-chain amino acid ABC transporter permease [Nocardioides terrisoli]|uniref:branched-chain amino acid ABC transporter permease n=1 Tax=Nocardioides terrisoli TaxID=3388267 RepID=UPI00287B5E4A|nr:branched-chain amino acid ABC transporter permease [Nocardioides marmorisolisilvae]
MDVFLQTLVTGISDATLFVMLSLGLTLMFGVLGVVNLAQGDFMTVAAYVGVAVVGLGMGPVLALGAMVPALAVLAVIFYYGVIRPTAGRNHENQLLATFGCAFLLQGLIQAVWGPDPKAARQSGAAWGLGGVSIPHDVARNLLVAVVAVALLWMLLNRSRVGRQIRAMSQDPVGAELLGINTSRIGLIAAIVACALTAVGGVILLSISNLSPTTGYSLILSAFAVVIVGGLGSLWGTVAASLILGFATELVATYVGSGYTSLVTFVAIVVVLLARPQGLAGSAVIAR